MFKGKKILVGLSGSISAYKVCELISALKKQGAEVRVMATDSALEFVGLASLEGLSGEAVLTSDFSSGRMMDHIHLTKWADLFIIAPATAQTLNSLAHGVGHGILISSYLAYDLANKPLLIAPAMNTQMFVHPTTQASMQKLLSFGAKIIEPDAGPLACGDVGVGRLAEPETILDHMRREFAPAEHKARILITAGGTKVPIDNVRAITNTSTGKTGSSLADFFSQKGYQVDLLLSKNGVPPTGPAAVFYYETYEDLKNLMQEKITQNKYAYIFHAAAVSDYTIDEILSANKDLTGGKLPSGENLSLHLKPTEKIISHIKSWSPQSQVIAFKLTSTDNANLQKKAIDKLFTQPVDWVVHNDLADIQPDAHRFTIYGKDGSYDIVENKNQLAQNLEKTIFQREIL